MIEWTQFFSTDADLDPRAVKTMILDLETTNVTSVLENPITGETHLDFEFSGFPFSFHNPYGGGYGILFFYRIANHNPQVTAKLKDLLASRIP